jgi:undecaprenyl-diphosphatase
VSDLMLRLSNVDERILGSVVRHRRPILDAMMRGVTRLADVRVIVPVTLALAFGAVPELEGTGRLALRSLIVSHLMVQLLKRRICRPRPLALSCLVDPEDLFSFPSGHATAALSVALPLSSAFGGLLGIVVVLLGLSIGLSRCYLGVHYPSDVAVGWGLATTTVVLMAILSGAPG